MFNNEFEKHFLCLKFSEKVLAIDQYPRAYKISFP